MLLLLFFSLSIIRFYPLQLVIAILFPKHSILQCEANILQKQCCPNDHTAGFFFVCHSLKYVPVSYCSKKNLLISRSSDCLNLRTQFVLHVAHLITKIQHTSYHVNLFSLTWIPFNLQWHRTLISFSMAHQIYCSTQKQGSGGSRSIWNR